MNDYIDSATGTSGYSRSSDYNPQNYVNQHGRNYQTDSLGNSSEAFNLNLLSAQTHKDLRPEYKSQHGSDRFNQALSAETTTSFGPSVGDFNSDDPIIFGASANRPNNFGNHLASSRYQDDSFNPNLANNLQLGLAIDLRQNMHFSEQQNLSNNLRSISSANLNSGFVDLSGGYSGALQNPNLLMDGSNDINPDFIPANDFLGIRNIDRSFPSQPSSPVKMKNLMDKSHLNVSKSNISYMRSVPASRKTSPELNHIWDSLESLSIGRTKDKINSAFKSSNYSNLDNINPLSKNSNIPLNENLVYNEHMSKDLYLDLNQFNSNDSKRGISAPINNFNDKYDCPANNGVEFDPQLPSGLLDDDEGLYFTKNKSPSALDNMARNQDILSLKSANFSKIHDQGYIKKNNYDPVYNDFQNLPHYNSQNLSDFNNINSSVSHKNLSDNHENHHLGFDMGNNDSTSDYNQNHNAALNQFKKICDNRNVMLPNNAYHDMNQYGQFDINSENRQILINNNQSIISNGSMLNGNYMDLLHIDKYSQNDYRLNNDANDCSLLPDSHSNRVDQPPDLVRNYSMPAINNPQSSLLQQHYHELSKLLAVAKDKPSSELSNSTSNGGFNMDNALKSSSTELGKSQSSVNLQSNNSNRHNRKHDVEHNKYTNMKLEELEHRIFSVCKDQYGCRYLQKQLEDGSTKQIEMIYKEITPHYSKLMVDPFGNYLCQKLFEYCNEKQRTHIIKLISKDIVDISLNIHGTRASQKLIDLLTIQEQVDYIIEALKNSVVHLIRDLNGNHVIQKCLNKLINTPESDNKHNLNVQFIYDSVAKNCIEVATHRHGCCVFQRCIDVASSSQLNQLVKTISENALSLVQDPFGNYVVQYILDLNSAEINEVLISRFVSNYAKLSKQKFSSNVMEKCFKLSNQNMQNMIVASILQNHNQHQLIVLADLISDSFGNYVIQTILDFLIDQKVKHKLIDAIKMIQNNIKLTPYGKRIINKLYRDGFVSNINSTCPSNNNSRISSPVLSNPRVQLFNNQNQINTQSLQVSLSSPNLLSHAHNHTGNLGLGYNNYLNINPTATKILGNNISPYNRYNSNIVNKLNSQTRLNHDLGMGNLPVSAIGMGMRGNVTLNANLNAGMNKYKTNE
ncbi:hypothetical protein BB561_006254 [Smittium simulii]|uniref:PUM-HD domain-containing protein n=1 Tax=Smittium simulii TaxID=133385 RepID=A0A2T9Y5R1_9FUNG|nr:hypothetical protein BB561_006254 [Smittium simulii]